MTTILTAMKLIDHSRCVWGQEELLDVILDDFVHSKGAVSCLDSVAELSDPGNGMEDNFFFALQISKKRMKREMEERKSS